MAAEDRVRALHHQVVRAGEHAVIRVAGGPTVVLPAPLASLLGGLTRFRTVHGHIEHLRARTEPARRAIRRLHELGLVETEVSHRARWPSRGPDPAPISFAGVPTRDRPGAVSRAVRSIPGDVPVVVVDTSRASALDVPPRCLVLDLEAIARLADNLGERIGDVRAARLALGVPRSGWQAGAARNVLLLLGAGRGLVSLDDDVSFEVHDLAPVAGPGAFCTSGPGDPNVLVPARSVQAALDAHPVCAADVVSRFSTVLGQPAEVLIGAEPLGGRPALGERLVAGARAVAVRAGVVGDHGLGSALPTLAARGGDLRRIAGSEAHFAACCASRGALRASREAVLHDTAGFMTPIWAVDLRALVPPFPPWGKASDAVWGALLHRVRTDAVVAHLPFAAAHRPVEDRPFDLSEQAAALAGLRFRDVVVDVVLRTELLESEPRARLAALAVALQHRSRLDVHDLQAWLVAVQHRVIGGRLTALTRPLGDVEPAAGWLALRDRTAATLRRALAEGPRLLDVEGSTDLQCRLGELGTVLRAWPDLFDAVQGRTVGPTL